MSLWKLSYTYADVTLIVCTDHMVETVTDTVKVESIESGLCEVCAMARLVADIMDRSRSEADLDGEGKSGSKA